MTRRRARRERVHRFRTRNQGSLLCSAYSGETVASDRAMSVTVNDVHAQLNEASVSDVVAVDSLAAIQAAVRKAASEEKSVAIAGGRHAMGGQQFCSDGVLLDTRELARVLEFDPEAGTLEVEAGIQWPDVIDYLAARQAGREPQWGIAQKQTGADRLSIGGGLGGDGAGRGAPTKPPLGGAGG